MIVITEVAVPVLTVIRGYHSVRGSWSNEGCNGSCVVLRVGIGASPVD